MQPIYYLPAVALPAASFRPLISGVQAGFPSPAADYMETPIDLNEHIIQHPAATFFMQVEGESMTGAHIMPGSLLVVDRSLTAKNNDIIVAVVDGDYTVKRLVNSGIKKILMPYTRNPKFQPIEINEFTDCTIWGVVTRIITEAKIV